jgi:PEP-CTERM/exosortase A-associated glycosyltransferase
VKILHVLDHSIPLHSGYTFRSRSIFAQQRAMGWDTAHLTSTKHIAPGDPVEDVDGLRFYRTSPGRGALGRLPLLNQWDVVRALMRRLPEVIEQERPDLLHAHSPSLNGIAAIRVGRRLGLPVVYECRAFWEDAAADHGTSSEWGPRYRATRALESWVFRHADAVTCLCEGLRADILSRGIPEAKVTVIPNAVDTDRFTYVAPRDEELAGRLGLAQARVLGFLGSFYAYEGLKLAVQALPAIVAREPDVRLLLVGGGPQEQALKGLARRLGIADKVLFTGRVPHDQVESYYSLVDLLVYPRLPMRLTDLVTPLKPLEAMAQGKLLLASDVGGHRELIRDGVNGVLFRAGSAEALADAAVAFLGQPERWEAQREAGRRYVEAERNWAASVGRYRDVYGAVVGGGGTIALAKKGAV